MSIKAGPLVECDRCSGKGFLTGSEQMRLLAAGQVCRKCKGEGTVLGERSAANATTLPVPLDGTNSVPLITK